MLKGNANLRHISFSSCNDKHHLCSFKSLRAVFEEGKKTCFCLFVLCERCATWVMCHDNAKLERFCWRQAYLLLCLCTKWLIGLWINMICFQGFDSEYPDYANLPPSQERGKLKNDKAFLWCGTGVCSSLVCDLHYWGTPRFCYHLDKSCRKKRELNKWQKIHIHTIRMSHYSTLSASLPFLLYVRNFKAAVFSLFFCGSN